MPRMFTEGAGGRRPPIWEERAWRPPIFIGGAGGLRA